MRRLLPIYAVIFVDILALTVVLPLLPYYAESFGASPGAVGTLIAVFAGCQLLSSPVMGKLSDRYGRRRLLLASQAGTVLGFLVLGTAHSLASVFLGRIIDGLTAGNISVAQAYIADHTPPSERPQAFSYIGMAFGIGFLVGPAGGSLMAAIGPRAPMLGAAGIALAALVLTATLLRPDHRHAEVRRTDPLKSLFPRLRPAASPRSPGQPAVSSPPSGPGGWRLFALFFLFAFGFCAFNGGFALFAERRFDAFTAGEVGGVFAFAGMVGLVFQLGLTAKLIARFGERAVTLGGFLIAGIGYAALGQSYAVPAMLAAVALSASGNVLLRPALTTLISRQAGKARQGAAMGSVQAMQSAAQVVAPLGSGWLIGGGGLVGWSLMAAGALAAGFAASWRWARCEA